MTSISIFYQGAGIPDVEHLEADIEKTFKEIKDLLGAKHAFTGEFFLFLENEDEPAQDNLKLEKQKSPKGIKAHIHHCRHIEVSVTFNGQTVHHQFGPGTTIAKVKHWAAVKKFQMTDEEAGEHVLQISGTHDRPKPGTHLGALSSCKECRIAFDLLPNERVNGMFIDQVKA